MFAAVTAVQNRAWQLGVAAIVFLVVGIRKLKLGYTSVPRARILEMNRNKEKKVKDLYLDEFALVLVSFPSRDFSEVVCERLAPLFSNVRHERLTGSKWHCAMKDEAIRLVIKNYDPEVILLRDADVMLIPKEKELHTHSDTKEQLVK